MEAVHFLSSYQLPCGDLPGQLPGDQSQVWAVAMQATLMRRSLWDALVAGGVSDCLAEFLGHDGMNLAVSQAADAHNSLRDGAWEMRHEQRQKQILRYVERIMNSSSPLSSKLRGSPHALEALVMEIFADALVLAAWLVEVEFFRSSRTQDEKREQLQESVLAMLPMGINE